MTKTAEPGRALASWVKRAGVFRLQQAEPMAGMGLWRKLKKKQDKTSYSTAAII